jgi:hypothetical protein
MEQIDAEEFKRAEDLAPTDKAEAEAASLTDDELQEKLTKMKSPMELQKEVAIQVGHTLKIRMEKDLRTTGQLTDGTRRWCELYNKLLSDIQKGYIGRGGEDFASHRISHAQLAAKLREVKQG